MLKLELLKFNILHDTKNSCCTSLYELLGHLIRGEKGKLHLHTNALILYSIFCKNDRNHYVKSCLDVA